MAHTIQEALACQEVLLWCECRWCGQSDEAGPVGPELEIGPGTCLCFFPSFAGGKVGLILCRYDSTNSRETITLINVHLQARIFHPFPPILLTFMNQQMIYHHGHSASGGHYKLDQQVSTREKWKWEGGMSKDRSWVGEWCASGGCVWAVGEGEGWDEECVFVVL